MNNFKKLIVPYIFVTLLGVLLHFTYEWSGKNSLVGLFSATNESTWEHLKLAFFPMLILTIWEAFGKYKNDENFLPAGTIGIISAMLFIVTAFYTISGVIGKNIDFLNIAIYFLGIAFGFFIEKLVYGKTTFLSKRLSIIVLLLFVALFFIFTNFTPDIGIFKEP